MAVEEVFAPVGAMGGVCVLYVDTHVCGKYLCGEEDEEAGAQVCAACFHGFALKICVSHSSLLHVETRRTTTHLTIRISKCRHQHSQSQDDYTAHLQPGVPFALQRTRQHRRHRAKRAQNDMHRHGNVESECPIIEHVDGKEYERDVSPFTHRHSRRLERQGRRELGEGRCQCGEDELGEGDQKTCTGDELGLRSLVAIITNHCRLQS